MSTNTHLTGTEGVMRVDDDGRQYVDFYLQGVNELITQIPWAYVIDGVTSSWQSFRLEANTQWQRLRTLAVGSTQTITFRLGATGNAKLGGPTDFTVLVNRAPASSTGLAKVNVNGLWYPAIPYVKVGGVWRQAEPWARLAGEWKPASM